MKDYKAIFSIKPEQIKAVKCKHDGEIAYCNSLDCNGYCICKEVLCNNAVKIELKDGREIDIKE